MSATIRPARPGDEADILRLIRALADYEREPDAVEATVEGLRAAEGAARGCARMDWAVLDWNEPAKAFYRRLGARHNASWEPGRLDGEALAALQQL